MDNLIGMITLGFVVGVGIMMVVFLWAIGRSNVKRKGKN
jgi:hypothetical protein